MREINEDFFLEPQPFWKADSDTWRALVDTNVNGPLLMAKAVAPHMVENGWGRIINISANYETMQLPGFSPYGPSKAALEALTAVFAKDLEGTGVAVNSLLPGGATWSEMIPSNLPDEVQARILDPEIMVAPLLSLCLEKWIGGRFAGKDWDESVDPTEAARRIFQSAGFILA